MVKLLDRIAAFIRDIIGAKDIKTTVPSLVGKIIPELKRVRLEIIYIMKLMSPTERIGKKSKGIDDVEDKFSIEVSGLANDNLITGSVDDSLKSVQ